MTAFKKEFLFQGSYGSILYLPRVDVLNQLSLDTRHLAELAQQSKSKGKKTEAEEEAEEASHDFSAMRIKVMTQPPVHEAMENPRTKKKFPAGTLKDPITGEDLRESAPVQQDRSIVNQIIYSNPDEGLVYYVDQLGRVINYTTGHLIPLAENHNLILSVLDGKIAVDSTFHDATGAKQRWDAAAAESLFHIDPKDKSQAARAARDHLRSMSNVDVDRKGGVPLFFYAKNKGFKAYVDSELAKIHKAIEMGLAPVRQRRGAPTAESVKLIQLGSYYASLICASLFADQHSKFFSGLKAEEEKTTSISASDAPKVPHIRQEMGGAATRFLPHQAYALSFLKDKKVAMVDADPGAGKTLIILADILDKMNRGLVDRPCIVMPNNLLADQKRELEEWTAGTVNFVVVCTSTIRSMDPENLNPEGLPKKTGGNPLAGLREMEKLIKSAPKNTVILTSYDWLRGGPDDQVRTDSGIRFRNPSWLVARLGIDMLVLDESHAVRAGASGNPSKRAEAVMQMASLVPYRRCYSGTIAPSGPDDIWMQCQFLDPSVLGDRTKFKERYALSESGGASSDKKKKRQRRGDSKIEEFKDGAIKEIRSLISRRLGVSIRRSAWLNELPRLEVKTHKAILTGPQRVVYERLVDRIINEELFGNVDPGTIGLELQRAMRDHYANNPTARDQISKWSPSLVVTLPDMDKQDEDDFNEEDVELDAAELAEKNSLKFDLNNPEAKAAFKLAQKRIRDHWGGYRKRKEEQASRNIDDDDDRLVDEEEFAPLLTKFVKIDRFLSCPPSDDFGKHFLAEDEDRISPKVKVINEILARHFADPGNGKVIIFTQYKDVATHILQHIAMADRAVYYAAGEKQALASFKSDPSVQIIVAVDQSIREGQNLQMANRIIRVDMPWNPGDYEQSIARSYRLPPKDPEKKRYPVIYIDIIVSEGTAEITKFARMVSKMHKVRQLISGYSSTQNFRLIKMNLENMQNLKTYKWLQTYENVYKDIRESEQQEAAQAPHLYGNQSYELADGSVLEGSEKLETPITESDRAKTPRDVKPQDYKMGVVDPKFFYYNGAAWLSIDYMPRTTQLTKGFQTRVVPGLIAYELRSIDDARELLNLLSNNDVLKMHVVNIRELATKLKGQAPIDPSFPDSVIKWNNTTRKFAAAFNPNLSDPAQVQEILGYKPTQEDQRTSLALLQRASKEVMGGKDITPIHALAAAKMLGYFRTPAKDLDLTNFWKKTKTFSVLPTNVRVLTPQLEQMTPLVPTPPAAGQQPPGPVSGTIPGLEPEVGPEGVPITLQVALLGSFAGSAKGSVVQSVPCFVIDDTSGFSMPGLGDKVVDALLKLGFRRVAPNQRTWIYLGSTKAEATKSIRTIAKRLYAWGYVVKDPASFDGKLSHFGLSIDELWPKKEIEAMARLASHFEEFPEYTHLVNDLFLDD